MNKYTFTTNTHILTRVTKAEARKLWEAGKAIGFCPAKLSPVAFGGAFIYTTDKANAGEKCIADPQFGVLMTSHTGEVLYNYGHVPQTFDDVESNFRVYNCNSNETGKYTAFYLVTERVKAVA